MAGQLAISIGQYSDKGRKETNQDFHGVLIPQEPLLGTKGIAIALADGISTSSVSHIASESAVKSFLDDYYCTSESWSVKTSAQRVIAATNSWLHAQTRRSEYLYDHDKGYVCTFSAIVLKSATAHLFHIGDSRIYRLSSGSLEQLTDDHRIIISSQQNYLGRALGVNPQIEIDYLAVPLEIGDIFVLVTDGVYEHISRRFVAATIAQHTENLDNAARLIGESAFERESTDNLTIQIIRIDALPDGEAGELVGQANELPLPPILEPRMEFDGYRILRELHSSSRSHLYLAEDIASGTVVVLKIPSIDLRGDPGYRRRFLMEEWAARRINSAHVLKPGALTRKRNYLYVATEYIEGTTLAQWMIDNPKPDLETARGIVEQIAKGLRAFHRLEMLHQDLRPENIMIDKIGTVKLIDLGAARIAGIAEAAPLDHDDMLGTVQYAAPEYFLGETGTERSDLFSLGVIAYQMLTGALPYGAQVARTKTKAQQKKLKYRPATTSNPLVPAWIDGALKRAVHPDPGKRYEALSEFLFDLREPNAKYTYQSSKPLIERNPLLFWKFLSLILALAVVLLLASRHFGY